MELRPQSGPQEAFLSTPADIAIYGGAGGGGKTFGVLLEGTRFIQHGKYRALYFRRITDQIRSPGGLWDESVAIFSGLKGKPIESKLTWVFPSGARIKFNHLEHEKNVDNYQGSQIPLIVFDELTHFTRRQFMYMVSRNRSIHGFPCIIRATCNPDPDSFVRQLIDWWIGEDGFPIKERSGVLRWFVVLNDEVIWGDTKEELQQLTPDDTPRSLTFIPAKLEDNKILMKKDPAYRARLMSLDKVERERLLGGNWNVRASAGMYFKKHYFEEVESHPRLIKKVRAWDRAATEWKHGDPGDPDATAGVLMGLGIDKCFYILDAEHERYSSSKVKTMILNNAQRDGAEVTVKIFQDPGSAGKGEADDMKKALRGFHVHCETVSKSKETLAKAMSSQAEFGNIKILKSCRKKEALLKELEGFPDMKHDDLVDAATSAFNFLNMDNVGEMSQNMIQKGSSIIGAINPGDSW